MIRKVLVFIAFCALVATIRGLDCLDGNTCGEDETCCYDSSGSSGCCMYKEAVCCSDHEHCCPQNTSCDLVHMVCQPKSDFLSEFFPMKKKRMHVNTFTLLAANNQTKTITQDNIIDIFNGFLEGSTLKPIFPDLVDCTANSTIIYSSLRDAITVFSNGTLENVTEGIRLIGITIQGLANVTTTCKKLPASLQIAINYFMKIANDPAKWFGLVSASATKNSIWIMMNLYGLDSLIKSEKFKDVGVKIGEVALWTFGVDLGNTTTTLFSKNNRQLSTSQAKFGGVPSIEHIWDCIKTVQPFASDIYNAVKSFGSGDQDAGMKYLTQAGIDAIGLGVTCWKVIQDIMSE